MNKQIGLVIGGGGNVGIAWEVGVFKALEDAGASLKNVGVAIGTSAGTLVGVQYFSGRDINKMVHEQLNPGWMVLATKLLPTKKANSLAGKIEETKAERGKRMAKAATETRAMIPESLYLKLVGLAIKVKDWPKSVDFMPCATDCETGELVILRQADGIPFRKAAASSCCVPKVVPPVTINGKKYIDGGCGGSSSNFEKVIETGVKRAIFIGPFGGEHSPGIGQEQMHLNEEIEMVKQAGIKTLIITPSPRLADECGTDMLNGSLMPKAFACGLEDGKAVAATVKEFIAAKK